ncbi:MAG: hypothetical protein IJR47_03605, partial [Clostridia bacterium]|nr:hypothetical protein [Clostridia bacterium]
MIKYKRIYPLYKNDRFAAVATVQGSDSAGEITVKFKNKPEEDGLCVVLFNPKTYDYELIPLQSRMYINRSVTELTGCAVVSKNGMLIDILMAGTVDKSTVNTSKLKSVIAMDLYSSCPCEEEKPEQNGNEELMDYLQEMDGTA